MESAPNWHGREMDDYVWEKKERDGPADKHLGVEFGGSEFEEAQRAKEYFGAKSYAVPISHSCWTEKCGKRSLNIQTLLYDSHFLRPIPDSIMSYISCNLEQSESS